MTVALAPRPLPPYGRPRAIPQLPATPFASPAIVPVNPTLPGSVAQVAVYWDWENTHASLFDLKYGQGAYGKSGPGCREILVQVRPIVEYAASLGEIAIHRAYADWGCFGIYKGQMLRHALELIQLFHPGPKAKNGADIRIVLDAIVDSQHYPHVTHVVVIGGDSDYIGLVQQLRKSGVCVVGIGVEGSTNAHWQRACTEFKHYGALVGTKPATNSPPLNSPHKEAHRSTQASAGGFP